MDKKTPIAVEHIRTRKAHKIGRPKKKPKTWLFPQAIERQYVKELVSFSRTLSKLIDKFLIPEVPSMVAEVASNVPNNFIHDRMDDFLDRLETIKIYIRRFSQGDLDETIADALGIADQINSFNYAEFQKINESVFGVNIFLNEPWLQDQLKLFANQNADLIVSLREQELQRVSSIIERGLQDGTSIRILEKEIQKSFGITSRRAKLIARDQTTKLNGSLTKLRQQEVGVEEYVWQTSNDERVRPTHKLNDGKTFRWDKPPATGHPGTEVNCRCVALPVLDRLLNLV